MATIDQDIHAIRTAIYGRDVREAIADGFENLKDGGDVSADVQMLIDWKNDIGLSVVNGKLCITYNQ